jgi:hypothetical protein
MSEAEIKRLLELSSAGKRGRLTSTGAAELNSLAAKLAPELADETIALREENQDLRQKLERSARACHALHTLFEVVEGSRWTSIHTFGSLFIPNPPLLAEFVYQVRRN